MIAISVLIFLFVDVARRCRRPKGHGRRGSVGRANDRVGDQLPPPDVQLRPRSRSSTRLDELWHRKYAENERARQARSRTGGRRSRCMTVPRRAQRRRPRDPHAEPVLLAVGGLVRPSDHGLRRAVFMVGRGPRAPPCSWSGIFGWVLEPSVAPGEADVAMAARVGITGRRPRRSSKQPRVCRARSSRCGCSWRRNVCCSAL